VSRDNHVAAFSTATPGADCIRVVGHRWRGHWPFVVEARDERAPKVQYRVLTGMTIVRREITTSGGFVRYSCGFCDWLAFCSGACLGFVRLNNQARTLLNKGKPRSRSTSER
jgi:hypothetical protein